MTAGQGSMSKLKAGEVAMWCTTALMDLIGPEAGSEDHPLQKFFRDAKIFQLFEGTSQIQRLVIARMQTAERRQDREVGDAEAPAAGDASNGKVEAPAAATA
jgi:alkylation response protein AidB-like acyl-CoA dehydrogenase